MEQPLQVIQDIMCQRQKGENVHSVIRIMIIVIDVSIIILCIFIMIISSSSSRTSSSVKVTIITMIIITCCCCTRIIWYCSQSYDMLVQIFVERLPDISISLIVEASCTVNKVKAKILDAEGVQPC